MLKNISIVVFIFCLATESAFARAGGRSSFGSGRSSTSYFNQGSRGSRTFEGGGSNGKNYAPMQKSTTPDSAKNNPNQAPNNQQQPQQQQSFFQRNPMLSTIGAVVAGSWIGNMLFGNHGANVNGAAEGGNSFFGNFLTMALLAFAAVMLFRFLSRRKNMLNSQNTYSSNQSVTIQLDDSEMQKFSELLISIQNAWSQQDLEKLKTLTTLEMSKYFSDALAQNISQNIANIVENIDVTGMQISESWQEDQMQYATVILEWSALDYIINKSNSGEIIEGSNQNLVITSEAWTFVRFSQNGKWILSAIAQIE
jgi:predicted lipid-binding transport protein (Tim44 family)